MFADEGLRIFVTVAGEESESESESEPSIGVSELSRLLGVTSRDGAAGVWARWGAGVGSRRGAGVGAR
jgi:hypothetical protein